MRWNLRTPTVQNISGLPRQTRENGHFRPDTKYVCWLTDYGDYDEDHVARLHLLATLHPIDRFFMQTRRRVSLAERAVVSVRQQRRMWNGYGAYNPAVLQRYLEIYRTYYNYCLAGKD